FSGGLDATFTALRHNKILPDHVRYPLKDALMVHGFDVSLDHPEYFTQLTERTKPLLDFAGMTLNTVKTNSKALNIQPWEDSHAAELTACLHMFSHKFAYGLLGSGEPYDTLVFPCSSTPATNYLLSGDNFRIVHDGAGFSRTHKIEQIGRYAVALQTI